ncbi:uncharacterized protein LOC143287396 isoform X2 [Babylonia areolata]|uniref:uncharacterized protein LOC143287396 isoform X2 n=1 Tax=Babylonia areolata TaxID=304850 RepID=UPI003FCF2CAE
MSLFTDPELPPPIPAITVNGSTLSDSEEEMVFLDEDGPRPKRSLLTPSCSGTKGFVLLASLALVSMITVLYARERVQTLVTQAFSQKGHVTMTSSWYPPPPEVVNNGSRHPSQPRQQTASDDTQEENYLPDYDTTAIELDSQEPFPEDEEEEEEEEEQGLHDDDVSLLEEFLPMPDTTLHYLWCGHRFFDFRNYVAMKSAIEALQPKKVVFHYQYAPMKDPDGYFTWFERLSSLYPNIILVKVNTTADEPCYSGGFKRFVLVFNILKRYGGIYIPEDAIFLRFADRFRRMSFVSGVSSCNLKYFFEGIVIAKFGQLKVPATEEEQVRMLSVCHERHHDDDSLHPCTPEERYLQSPPGHVPSCVRLETALFPRNVWDSYDKVATLVKLIAYGKTDLQPRWNDLPMYRIPRMAHYLCTGDCVLSFTAYLSILSAIHVAGLPKVLIHGPLSPSGPWWDRLMADHSTSIFFLRKEFNYHGNLTFHVNSDMKFYIMRTEILLHYGGVFHDSHVLWTQPLPDELLQYEAVASPDWHEHGNWPESVNHGLLIARGGATYLQQLLLMYWDNVKSDSPWIADHYLSYRLIELDPTILYLHRHLQVKCLNHNCHPTWKPGYRSHFLLNRPGEAFDWSRETLSVHWLDAFQELEADQVRFTSGFIVDLAQHVLSAAGVDLNSL